MQSPHLPRVLLAFLLPLLPLVPPAAMSAPASPSPLARQFQPLLTEHLVAGAVALVGSQDRILDVEAMGYADLATRRPMRPDTLFWIASMSKAFTGTAVMMLVDEGKLRLDDPVEKYLPAFKDQLLVVERDQDRTVLRRPAQPITIRDLLTHTSGIVHRTPLEDRIDRLPLDENVMIYPLTPLEFPRGARYSYSNAGINTAGRIVELASGLSFADFLQQRLFGPLGMKDTTFWPDAEQVGRLAKSYEPGPGPTGLREVPIDQLSYPLSDPRRGVSPAGGLFSTAGDVYLFCRMIGQGGSCGGRHYLSSALVDEMTANQIGDLRIAPGNSLDYGYGLGWLTRRKVEHANEPVNLGTFGAGGAYNTNMWINRPRNLITVWMVQQVNYPDEQRSWVRNTLMKAAVAAYGQ